MNFERSTALVSLPPYLFIEIDRKKKAALAAGVDLVDLGVGDPDRPTPKVLIKALQKAALKPANHQYPLGSGMPAYKAAVAAWFMLPSPFLIFFTAGAALVLFAAGFWYGRGAKRAS